jgi:glycosyltransferase involved in cell wall biosynthesis
MPSRTLAVVSARCDRMAEEAVARGAWPRKDYLELIRALNADVVDYESVERHWFPRLLRRGAGAAIAQAVLAFGRRGSYDRIFCDGEHIGLPLALLLRLSRRRPRLVMLGHLLTTPTKRRIFRWLRPQAAIDLILVHGSLQRSAAINELGLSPKQVGLVPYQVECDFWFPKEVSGDELTICSAGLEYRDYPTFIRAVAGLDVHAVIAAGSRWSRHRDSTGQAAMPSNVEVTSLDYVGLRDLYARSRFVVVPVREIDNPAGITVILEAMAMGKAVIVTATRGQRDVVHGRLCTAAGVTDEYLGGPGAFGLAGPPATAETGLYVPPGDANALRTAIQYLLDHPDEAAEMGAAGRRLVAEFMNLDVFIHRLAAAIEGAGEPVSSVAVQRPAIPSEAG